MMWCDRRVGSKIGQVEIVVLMIARLMWCIEGSQTDEKRRPRLEKETVEDRDVEGLVCKAEGVNERCLVTRQDGQGHDKTYV